MNTASQNTYEHYRSRITDIQRAIESALQKLDSGTIVSLESLEREAAELCEKITQAPAEIQGQLQPDIANLIGQLDTLENNLQNTKHNLEEQL